MLEQVYRTSPEIGRLAQLAQSFFRMFKDRNVQALTGWLKAAQATALAGFAAGLERDLDAVREALRLPWNQGHVEGQVHRLKLIKRQMYGRAGFDLLRLRVFNRPDGRAAPDATQGQKRASPNVRQNQFSFAPTLLISAG